MPWRYCKGQNGGLGYYNTITLEIRDTKPDDFDLDTLTWTQGTHLKLHSEKEEELLGKAMRGETKKRDAEIERKVSRARARIEEAQKSTWVAT